MVTHTTAGADLLSRSSSEIMEQARIIAFTHVRPYKAAFPFNNVLRHLTDEAGTAFDPTVVAALDRARDGVFEALAPDGD